MVIGLVMKETERKRPTLVDAFGGVQKGSDGQHTQHTPDVKRPTFAEAFGNPTKSVSKSKEAEAAERLQKQQDRINILFEELGLLGCPLDARKKLSAFIEQYDSNPKDPLQAERDRDSRINTVSKIVGFAKGLNDTQTFGIGKDLSAPTERQEFFEIITGVFKKDEAHLTAQLRRA